MYEVSRMNRFLGVLFVFTALLFGVFSTAETNDAKSFALHVAVCLLLGVVGLLLLLRSSRPSSSNVAARPTMREFPVERIELHLGFRIDAMLPSDQTFRVELFQKWSDMRRALAQEACQLYENYTDGEHIEEGKIWGTMLTPVLRAGDTGAFQLSCSFTWQDVDDSHVVTFYFRDWKLVEHTVDG